MSRGQGNGAGRPKMYDKELAERVCMEISTSSDSVDRICYANPEFPSPRTIFRWRVEFPEFNRLYMISRQHQVEVLIDEILEIADNKTYDTKEVERKDGSTYEVCNLEWIVRSKIRIDTRRWLATKLCPNLYGDRVYNENNLTIRHEDALKELE